MAKEDDTKLKSLYDRIQGTSLRIAGEYANDFLAMTRPKNNIKEIPTGFAVDVHFILASIAASENSFVADFHKRGSGNLADHLSGVKSFSEKDYYEHSGTARKNTANQLNIIISVAYKYYKNYLKSKDKNSIKTFQDLYYKQGGDLIRPLNLAASKGVEILIKKHGFDSENNFDGFYKFLFTRFLKKKKL